MSDCQGKVACTVGSYFLIWADHIVIERFKSNGQSLSRILDQLFYPGQPSFGALLSLVLGVYNGLSLERWAIVAWMRIYLGCSISPSSSENQSGDSNFLGI